MFIPYRLADGSTVMVEVTEETAAYFFESNRELGNAERRASLYSLPVFSLSKMKMEKQVSFLGLFSYKKVTKKQLF